MALQGKLIQIAFNLSGLLAGRESRVVIPRVRGAGAGPEACQIAPVLGKWRRRGRFTLASGCKTLAIVFPGIQLVLCNTDLHCPSAVHRVGQPTMRPSRWIGLLLPVLLHRAAANDCAAAREGLITWWICELFC